MKMASRNIANMHLFLEMKKKFPDLPEDTLRNYVFLYAEDKNKCVSLLQKESKNYFHSSKKFSDFSENKTRLKKHPNMIINIEQAQDPHNFNPIFLQNLGGNQALLNKSEKQESVINKQAKTTHITSSSTINLPLKTTNLNIPPSIQEAKSAPVLENFEKPFADIYKNTSMPSSSQKHALSGPNNRMMFSTTKEHTIFPSDETEMPKNAVKMSITPSFPFPQHQMSVYTSAVSTSQTSKPGRHTTSLNFQLQPHSSDRYPVEISTVPTNIGSPCDFRDFGSHLQISVGAQGATFTALRLQRPQNNPSANQLPDQPSSSYPSSSSQDASKVYRVSTHLQQVNNSSRSANLSASKKGNDSILRAVSEEGYQTGHSQISSLQPERGIPSGHFNALCGSAQGFQATPAYVLAVKNHQTARLDIVREELEKEKNACSMLKTEVNSLEQEIVRRQEKKSSFSYAELLKKLKDENRKLRIECNCLLMEYDISSKGQIPVGMTDEDFYSNIFTGPNDVLKLYSNDKNASKTLVPPERKLSGEEEEDERNRWKCKKCTFANHPALEKCEMCELSKNSGYVEYCSNYSSSSHLKLVPSTGGPQRRSVGSVQISVTRRVPSNSKGLKLQLTHRIPR